jgi:hypothetical protein
MGSVVHAGSALLCSVVAAAEVVVEAAEAAAAPSEAEEVSEAMHVVAASEAVAAASEAEMMAAFGGSRSSQYLQVWWRRVAMARHSNRHGDGQQWRWRRAATATVMGSRPWPWLVGTHTGQECGHVRRASPRPLTVNAEAR